MNTTWSKYVQKIATLYQTRMLRFDDRFKEDYVRAFDIDSAKRILEIGAGPGALTQALCRWYSDAEVVGLDIDAKFVKFAKAQASNIRFIEGDINSLPLDDNSFDVVISHTVQEHVVPGLFFREQYSVLKPDGVCLVLSARRGINIAADVISETSEFEKEMHRKTEHLTKAADEKYGVGKYSCTEQEMPHLMGMYGFKNIRTKYLTINLTPDSEEHDIDFGVKMINANRRVHLDSIELLHNIAADSVIAADSKIAIDAASDTLSNGMPNGVSDTVSNEDLGRWAHEINKKYDTRTQQYLAGDKQWDTNISLTMVLRGVK